MHSRATDRKSASKCQGKWPDQTLDQAFGLPEVLVAVSTSRLSCKRAGKTRTLMPVWDSSGESRLKAGRSAVFRGNRGTTVASGVIWRSYFSDPARARGNADEIGVSSTASNDAPAARRER